MADTKFVANWKRDGGSRREEKKKKNINVLTLTCDLHSSLPAHSHVVMGDMSGFCAFFIGGL